MQLEHEIDQILIRDDILREQPQIHTKLNFSIERKMERLWKESEKQGWKFSQFVAAALEVLTILHHRNKLRTPGQEPERVRRAKRILS